MKKGEPQNAATGERAASARNNNGSAAWERENWYDSCVNMESENKGF
jgi:hypothetical protein